MDENELNILGKMKKGDVSALNFFYEKYFDNLYFYALGFVKDAAIAEDIVQNIFIKFWENKNRIHITFSVQSYLNTAVKNACQDYYAHLKVRSRYETYYKNVEGSEFHSIENEESSEDLYTHVESLINSLPDKCKEIFIFASIEGMKYKEIAEKMDISVNTVKTQLKVAYKKLGVSKNNHMDLIVIALFFLFF